MRDNLFAFGGEGQVAVSRPEEHVGLTFSGNVVIGEGRPAFSGHDERPDDVRSFHVRNDLNLFWDYAPIADGVIAANGSGRPDETGRRVWSATTGRDEAWRAAGRDRHSVVADPGFRDVSARDFTWAAGSPVGSLGISVPSTADAGPRPLEDRRHPLVTPTSPDQYPPTRARSVF